LDARVASSSPWEGVGDGNDNCNGECNDDGGINEEAWGFASSSSLLPSGGGGTDAVDVRLSSSTPSPWEGGGVDPSSKSSLAFAFDIVGWAVV
jgi:hypothetical protein